MVSPLSSPFSLSLSSPEVGSHRRAPFFPLAFLSIASPLRDLGSFHLLFFFFVVAVPPPPPPPPPAAAAAFCCANVLTVCMRIVAKGDFENASLAKIAGIRVDSFVLYILLLGQFFSLSPAPFSQGGL